MFIDILFQELPHLNKEYFETNCFWEDLKYSLIRWFEGLRGYHRIPWDLSRGKWETEHFRQNIKSIVWFFEEWNKIRILLWESEKLLVNIRILNEKRTIFHSNFHRGIILFNPWECSKAKIIKMQHEYIFHS